MEETIKKISEIVDAFAQEQIGSILKQFPIVGLKAMILGELNKLREKKDE